MKFSARSFSVLLLFLGVCGCGPTENPNAPATVTGSVTYNEKPVTAGTISFFPKTGGVSTGAIRADGTYVVTDVPVGEAIVIVETESANPAKKAPVYGAGKGGKSPMASPMPESANAETGGGAYVKIPAKYADKTKSGLVVTLERGKQVEDIKLTD